MRMEKVNQIHIVPNGGEFDGDLQLGKTHSANGP